MQHATIIEMPTCNIIPIRHGIHHLKLIRKISSLKKVDNVEMFIMDRKILTSLFERLYIPIIR